MSRWRGHCKRGVKCSGESVDRWTHKDNAEVFDWLFGGKGLWRGLMPRAVHSVGPNSLACAGLKSVGKNIFASSRRGCTMTMTPIPEVRQSLMSIIHVNHIQSNCRARFEGLIDLSDVKTSNSQERDNFLLTRSLSAFSMAALAKIDDATAATSVVDEFGDDGIDAFFFDSAEHRAYLVQAKWDKDGSGSIDLGAVLKFKQGVEHFLAGSLDLLGPKMQAKASAISDALSDSQATFVLAIAYTGKPALSAEVRQPLDELLSDLNDDGDFVSLEVLRQKELHGIVEKIALGKSVDLTVLLHEYGVARQPYKAFYGQMDVTDISAWGKYGDYLYHRNIRGFKGSTEVNDSIVATVKGSPENFLYFNNGITLLCSSVDKQPIGGKSRDSGVFDCKDASVVNGAQTVGSILTAGSAIGSNARVMVRLISLENCPVDFGSQVTRAANTQNKIEERDFAALDDQQARLRSDLLLSLGREYVFRTGDQPPSKDKGCTLDEATVALACAHEDATHAVNAKQAIGRFYKDITKPPYTLLFNSSLTAIKLWRAVETSRAVDDCLKQIQKERDGKEKLCAIHGNRVLTYLVFKELKPGIFDGDNIAADLARVPQLVSTYLEKITAQITTNHEKSYVGNVFKNIKKCKEIIDAIA
jgi:AIPR protein